MPLHTAAAATGATVAALQAGEPDKRAHASFQVDATGETRWLPPQWPEPLVQPQLGVLSFLADGGDPRDLAGEAAAEAWRLKEDLLYKVVAQKKARRRAAAVLSSSTSNARGRHPMWIFEMAELKRPQVIFCSITLFFAGILCAAGGIGGGGIYVTVLMVAGGLTVVDAVPLSKAIVFVGSVPSLVLNMRKKPLPNEKTVIDYNICRLVVPGALVGTFLGVFLNRILSQWVLLLVLTLMLLVMTIMVTRTAWEQYSEEQRSAKGKALEEQDEMESRELAEIPCKVADVAASEPDNGGQARQRLVRGGAACGTTSPTATPQGAQSPSSQRLRNKLTNLDVCLAALMLISIVICSVFRHHAEVCRSASPDKQDKACNHPVFWFFGEDTMISWMSQRLVGDLLLAFAVIVPFSMCGLALFSSSCIIVGSEGWRWSEAICFMCMAVITGGLAGLVGIGGGLIFSPFFLLMGVEPAVAVATSSTCVIFTSSSTTLQYLLTDRIITSLVLVYGLVNFLACYAGTSLVHFLMDNFHTRHSFLSGIVVAGVLISTVLSLLKFCTALTSEEGLGE